MENEITIERLALLCDRLNACHWDPLLGTEPTNRKDRLKTIKSAYDTLVSTVGNDVMELICAYSNGGSFQTWLEYRYKSQSKRKRSCFWNEMLHTFIRTLSAIIGAFLAMELKGKLFP